MYKVVNIDFSIVFYKKHENLFLINFKNLEIEIENKLFVLTPYEDRCFTYDLYKSKILEKNKIFSFMNGKEFLISPEALFVSKNKVLLEKEILNKIKEHENKSHVSEKDTKKLTEELNKFNNEALGKIYLNMIDIALDNNDRELFEELVKARSKFIKY